MAGLGSLGRSALERNFVADAPHEPEDPERQPLNIGHEAAYPGDPIALHTSNAYLHRYAHVIPAVGLYPDESYVGRVVHRQRDGGLLLWPAATVRMRDEVAHCIENLIENVEEGGFSRAMLISRDNWYRIATIHANERAFRAVPDVGNAFDVFRDRPVGVRFYPRATRESGMAFYFTGKPLYRNGHDAPQAIVGTIADIGKGGIAIEGIEVDATRYERLRAGELELPGRGRKSTYNLRKVALIETFPPPDYP